MKVVTILGDSISLVRPNESISLQDTYPYKLQENLGNEYYVVNNAIRGSHAKMQLKNMADTVLHNNSEVVIIFFGIVDCFPRLFTLFERKIMAGFSKLKLDFINTQIIKIKSKNRYVFTKFQKKVYTEIWEFDRIYSKIIKEIEATGCNNIILINIPSPNDTAKIRNFGADENIKNYNLIISKYSKIEKIEILDFYTLTKDHPELVLDDGMHINKKGHHVLAEILTKKILNNTRLDTNEKFSQ